MQQEEGKVPPNVLRTRALPDGRGRGDKPTRSQVRLCKVALPGSASPPCHQTGFAICLRAPSLSLGDPAHSCIRAKRAPPLPGDLRPAQPGAAHTVVANPSPKCLPRPYLTPEHNPPPAGLPGAEQPSPPRYTNQIKMQFNSIMHYCIAPSGQRAVPL